MKNLIVNIYKTLFFFDFSIVVAFMVAEKRVGAPKLVIPLREGIFLLTLLVFTFVFSKFIERGKLKIFNFKNITRHYSLGLLSAIIPLAFTTAIVFIFRGVAFSGVNKVEDILYWLLATFFNVAAYELLLRGYLFRLYRRYYSFPIVAAIITALFISLNIGIFKGGFIYAANMLLFNFLLCLLAEYTRSVLAPLTAHFVYNALSGYMLGSLTIADGSPVFLKTAFMGKLTGGGLGLEGSIIMLIALVLVCGYFILKIYPKLPKQIKSKIKRA